MNIKEITLQEYQQINNQSFSNYTVFNSFEWLNLYDSIKLFGIFDKENKVIGCFYFHLENKMGIKMLRNLPYSPFIGLLFENKAKNRANYHSFEKKIISSIADHLDSIPHHLVSIAFQPCYKDMQPFFWKNYKVIPYYTYTIDLSQSEESLRNSMAPERRNDLNKGIKDQIQVKQVKDMQLVKDLVIKTFDRKQKSLNESMIDKILFKFANDSNSFAFVSFKNDQPIAASFCIHDNNISYYLLGGYDSQNKHSSAGAMAVWSAILHSKKCNIKHFDFEGSSIKAIESYFRGFGGNITPYFTVNKANLLIEMALKFNYRHTF